MTIGFLGVIVEYGVFAGLYSFLSISKELANLVASVLAMTHNFTLNAFFNFHVHDGFIRRLLTYYAVGAVGTLITTFILFVGVDLLGISPYVVKAFAIVIIAVLQFNLNSRITFISKQSQTI